MKRKITIAPPPKKIEATADTPELALCLTRVVHEIAVARGSA